MAPPRSAYPRPADEDDPQVIRCLGRTSLGCCFLRDLKLNAYSLRRVWRNRYFFLSYSFVFVCVIRVFVCLFVVIIANVFVIVFILGDVIAAVILFVLLNFHTCTFGYLQNTKIADTSVLFPISARTPLPRRQSQAQQDLCINRNFSLCICWKSLSLVWFEYFPFLLQAAAEPRLCGCHAGVRPTSCARHISGSCLDNWHPRPVLEILPRRNCEKSLCIFHGGGGGQDGASAAAARTATLLCLLCLPKNDGFCRLTKIYCFTFFV